jgi:hypothetical protein
MVPERQVSIEFDAKSWLIVKGICENWSLLLSTAPSHQLVPRAPRMTKSYSLVPLEGISRPLRHVTPKTERVESCRTH